MRKNKLFRAIAALALGLTMAIGAGAGIVAGRKDAKAVYADTVIGTFTKYSGVLSEGDYVVAHGSSKALANSTANTRINASPITVENNAITNPEETIVWHIAASGDYWTIFNAKVSKYAASTGAKNKGQLLDSGTDDMSLWSCSSNANSTSYDFVNKKNTANSVNANLRYNSTNADDAGPFAAYSTSTGSPLTLYKKAASTKTLSSISLSGSMTKKSYTTAENWDPSGLIVTGTYSDNSQSNLTNSATFKYYKAEEMTNENEVATPSALGAGNDQNIYIKATVSNVSNEDGYEQTVDVSVAVVTYTVTFDSNGGSAVDPQVVNSGEKVSEPSEPTKDDYSFDGWYTDTQFQNPYDFDSAVNSSFTLYAKWEEVFDDGAETYLLKDMTNFNSWGTGYSDHTSDFTTSAGETATVTIKSSNKQSSTITDVPVSKGGETTLVLTSEMRYIKSITFHAKQWGSKAQTMTLHTSNDSGVEYTDTGITSDNFRIRGTDFAIGTNAIKITFSSDNNQVGYVDFVVTYANLPTVQATSMSFTPSSLSLYGGDQKTFTPTLSGGTGDYEKTIKWESSHPAIIAAPADSEAGVAVNITPNAVATETVVTITGTVDVDGGAEGTIEITVKVIKTISVADVSISGITNNAVLNGENDNTVAINRKIQFSAEVEYNQGEAYMDGDGEVDWSTSDPMVATINSSGLATLVGNGTVTITATSVDNDAKSKSLSFTVSNIRQQLGSQTNPYTVAQARSAIDNNTGVEGVYAKGIVSEIVTPYSSQHGNISYNISSDGLTTSDQLQAYRGKAAGGVNFNSEDDVEIGATVLVYGNLIKFNSTYEFATDNQLIEHTPATKYTVSFVTNCDSVIPAQTVIEGRKAAEPEEPVKEQDEDYIYTFGGWYDNSSFDGEPYNFDTPVTSNLILHAKWNSVERSAKTDIENSVSTQSALSYTGYNQVAGDGSVDTLTKEFTGVSGSSYKDWSNKVGESEVVYAGNCYGASSNDTIQLNSNNSHPGIVVTDNATANKAKKITIKWNSSTANNRSVEVYGKDTAYDSTDDLYDAETKGTLIDTLSKNANNDDSICTIAGSGYKYIAIKATGALYIDSIDIQWGDLIKYNYDSLKIRFTGLISEHMWEKLDNQSTILGYGILCTTEDVIGNADIKDSYDTATSYLSSPDIKTTVVNYTNTKATPNLSNGNYGWSLHKNISPSDYATVFVAVAYIITDEDGVVFLNETRASAQSLAYDLIHDSVYEEDAFGGSLAYLANQ